MASILDRSGSHALLARVIVDDGLRRTLLGATMIQAETQTASGAETGHDKLWADWQAAHPSVDLLNTAEILQQALIMTRPVNQALTTQALGNVYA